MSEFGSAESPEFKLESSLQHVSPTKCDDPAGPQESIVPEEDFVKVQEDIPIQDNAGFDKEFIKDNLDQIMEPIAPPMPQTNVNDVGSPPNLISDYSEDVNSFNLANIEEHKRGDIEIDEKRRSGENEARQPPFEFDPQKAEANLLDGPDTDEECQKDAEQGSLVDILKKSIHEEDKLRQTMEEVPSRGGEPLSVAEICPPPNNSPASPSFFDDQLPSKESNLLPEAAMDHSSSMQKPEALTTLNEEIAPIMQNQSALQTHSNIIPELEEAITDSDPIIRDDYEPETPSPNASPMPCFNNDLLGHQEHKIVDDLVQNLDEMQVPPREADLPPPISPPKRDTFPSLLEQEDFAAHKTPISEISALVDNLKTKSQSDRKHSDTPFVQNVKKSLNVLNPGAWFNPDKLDPRVMNLIYWRDVKKSGVVFGSIMLILLSLLYLSLIAVVAYASLTILTGTITFRIYKNVMQAIQKSQDGHPFKEYLELDTNVSTEKAHELTDLVVSQLNSSVSELKRLFLVEDLIDSVKFAFLLCCLTYIGAWFNGHTLILLGVIALFTLPKVYEQNQAQFDQYIGIVSTQFNEVMNKVKAAIPIGKEKAQ